MKRLAFLAALSLFLSVSVDANGGNARPLVQTLFDFEQGVDGWRGNPWGGGEAGAEPSAEAKFGKGCLRGWYRNVERGATVISPYFPETPSWKQFPWSGMSLYFRGDGSAASVTVNFETDEKTHATYAASIPLQDT